MDSSPNVTSYQNNYPIVQANRANQKRNIISTDHPVSQVIPSSFGVINESDDDSCEDANGSLKSRKRAQTNIKVQD
jgi:hypothetical protein